MACTASTPLNGMHPTVEINMKFYDVWGSNETYPHYAVGWAWTFDTPYQWTKEVASHFGGTRNGMAMCWPARIKDKGGVRNQFHHVIDIVPTILEAAGLPEPKMVNGVAQKPIEGTSMVYTWDKANAPDRRTTQYSRCSARGRSITMTGSLRRRRSLRRGL